MLRNSADWRTLLWACGFAPAVVALIYVKPEWAGYLSPLACYFALSCGIIAHNHNHCPTFKSKGANQWFSNWISIFYGYPAFAWIPTHNLNHHKVVNKPGDATITWRHTNRHNFFIALTYPFISSYFQSVPTNEYIKSAKAKNPKLYKRIMRQYLVFWGTHAALLALAVSVHGWATGFTVFAFGNFIPAVFALWTIMLFNYEQHVHCDVWSEHNHSRSFTSPVLNFLLFNNGYHAAHHEKAGAHWTTLKKLHYDLEPHMDPRVNEKSVWWYWFRQYFLATFIPKLGTQQIGRAPFDVPKDQETKDAMAEVRHGETTAAV